MNELFNVLCFRQRTFLQNFQQCASCAATSCRLFLNERRTNRKKVSTYHHHCIPRSRFDVGPGLVRDGRAHGCAVVAFTGAGPLRVGGRCGPTLYAIPFFVIMAQTGGQLEVEYVPVTGTSQMAALFTSNQVDVMLGQVIQTANMFEQGEVRNLRIWTCITFTTQGRVARSAIQCE